MSVLRLHDVPESGMLHAEYDASAGGDPGQDKNGFHFALEPAWLLLRPVFAPYEISRAFVGSILLQHPQWIVIESLSAVTMDLARIGAALGFQVAVRLPVRERVDETDQVGLRWLFGLLSSVALLLPPDRVEDEQWLRGCLPGMLGQTGDLEQLPACTEPVTGRGGTVRQAGYEAYAFGRRDHALLYAMQAPFVTHFKSCRKVLDVGCGTGVFLEVLSRHGIAAEGVERNRMSADFARSLGHHVVIEDALAYLAQQQAQWDGVYCSHFIEHLPIEAAERLIALVAAVLQPGGVAVFVFPDPESIRSQLLGFWRDPEHVRFYHPELVAALAQIYGLEVEYDSQQHPKRHVVPFSMIPPLPEHRVEQSRGWWSGILRILGIAPAAAVQAAEARADALESVVRQLWAVNQTWAWDDNAVLCFRKHR